MVSCFIRKDENNAHLLCIHDKLGSFSFFSRSRYRQFMRMICREGVKVHCYDEPYVGTRIDDWAVHILRSHRNPFLFGAIISSKSYNRAVCKKMLVDLLEDLHTSFKGDFKKINRDIQLVDFSHPLKLLEFENAESYCRVTKLRGDIDNVKEIMLNTVDVVLERSVKIEDLVEKSSDLSESSKIFYRRAKSLNSRCCSVQ